ncbi:MAG: DUF86 domain-containing protein [Candidatus Hydrogenedentes bacterium]|nr:DUF86 domain-containing protein [Candidatus Hydrogenedentota bacterium]
MHDMLAASAEIRDLTAGVSLEDYLQNKSLRWAVERQYTIVGEALFQMQRKFPEEAARIPESNRIVRFRHVLVHGYAVVKDDVVWGLTQKKLPELMGVLQKLVGEEKE